MRFLPQEAEVRLYEDGFDNDLLGRAATGKYLSELVERFEDPLVIALDGRWGVGKSYFLKRWVGAHQLQNDGKATTVYFDAFANDFVDDPLISLVTAISARIEAKEPGALDHVKRLAFKFFRPTARIGLAVATAGASEALGAVGSAAATAVGDEVNNSLKAFWAREEGRRSAMDQFRAAIAELTAPKDGDEGNAKPLVIVVDELDRCRPDFALQVLEVIKHFFAVPRVHFVLGVNLSALECSVKARYGESIDATQYLQKFISFSIRLPQSVPEKGNAHDVEVIAQDIAGNLGLPQQVSGLILEHLKIAARRDVVSIRDVLKIISCAALLPGIALKPGFNHARLQIVVTLLVTRQIQPDLYVKLRGGTATNAEVLEYLGMSQFSLNDHPNEELKRKHGPAAYNCYLIWHYILSDGNVEDVSLSRSIESLFGTWDLPERARSFPQHIQREYLDKFRLGGT